MIKPIHYITDLAKIAIASIMAAVTVSLNAFLPKNNNTLTINTLYHNDFNVEKQKWIIDLKHYNIEYDEDLFSPIYAQFTVDNIEHFYDDCIKPYVSSQIGDGFVNELDKTVTTRLLFYDKAPYFYQEKGNKVTIYPYGYNSVISYFVPFFKTGNDLNADKGVLFYSNNYTSSMHNGVINNEFTSYLTCNSFSDARKLFEDHINPEAFKVDERNRAITIFAYKTIAETNSDALGKNEIFGFDDNHFIKLMFLNSYVTYIKSNGRS